MQGLLPRSILTRGRRALKKTGRRAEEACNRVRRTACTHDDHGFNWYSILIRRSFVPFSIYIVPSHLDLQVSSDKLEPCARSMSVFEFECAGVYLLGAARYEEIPKVTVQPCVQPNIEDASSRYATPVKNPHSNDST